jgi:hypothetical protein
MHHLCTPDDGNKPPFVYCLINGLHYNTLIWALVVVQNKGKVSRIGNERKNRANYNEEDITWFNGELAHQM